jgi:hypothetical protein
MINETPLGKPAEFQIPCDSPNYIVAYRQCNDFHETCVERMFPDISARLPQQ